MVRLATFGFLGAVLAGAALAAPEEPATPTVRDKDRATFIPKRVYHPLKGTTIGLLVSDVQPMMSQEGRSGPPGSMGFSAGNGSYRWVYVPVEEKEQITKLNVAVGEKGDKKKQYPKLSIANAALLKDRGVKADYALVEVEVNDKLGAPAEEAFVGTLFTRLDGTKKYPLKLPDVVEAMKKRYAADKKAMQKKIDAEMRESERTALQGRKVTGPRETNELMYLTWLPDSERVRVAFRTTIRDGAYTYVEGGMRPPRPIRPGKGLALLPPPPPMKFKVRVGTTFGVEVGREYEVDKTGKVVAARDLTPKGFKQELQPPP